MKAKPRSVDEAVITAARQSYGKLLALLAAPSRDIAAAEDALADAFERALKSWPTAGIPENPDAWLFTVARNRLRDLYKSSARQTVDLPSRLEPAENGLGKPDPRGVLDPSAEVDLDAIPDKRLELLFVCAHPAIDPAIRTPLMLQTVLGFESSQVAVAFAVPESAMAQRLVRAKRRIRDAHIPFVVPDRTDMPARLPAVLEAIYGAYAIDWLAVAGVTERESLAPEALYLAETLAGLLVDQAEAWGLAALLALSMSRAKARVGGIPLDEQDTAQWDSALIDHGELLLRRAMSLGTIGRFQLEAAIQSVHCAKKVSGTTDFVALEKLHRALVLVAPTLGARVALAATIAEVDGPHAGLRELDLIADEPGASRFQPAWATRAHLLAAAGRTSEARSAYEKAISLTTDNASRKSLVERQRAVVE